MSNVETDVEEAKKVLQDIFQSAPWTDLQYLRSTDTNPLNPVVITGVLLGCDFEVWGSITFHILRVVNPYLRSDERS